MQQVKQLYVLYHEVRPGGSRYLYVVDRVQFEEHCRLFSELLADEACQLKPEITFDDGHVSNYEVALPLLQTYGLTARFFITAGWTGQRQGYMDWEELRKLHSAGQKIGAHGWSHALLTRCSSSELEMELARPRLVLEDKLGTSITTMSLPGGRYNKRVIVACEAAGYTQIFTSEPQAVERQTRLLVGRLNIRGDATLKWLASVFEPNNHVLSNLERLYQLKSAAKTLLGDRLYQNLWAILNRKELQTEMGEATANEDSAHYQ
jgi:peptidoglycan/xylan/chitin deacetylase (PgdA/CDA1 family)